MKIRLNIVPPTTTAQMHKVCIINGHPHFYDPPSVKEAKKVLKTALEAFAPETPMDGPIELQVIWMFPCNKAHKPGTYRTTKPDTDNIEKLLKDQMTSLGYWKDDNLVAKESVTKIWVAENPGIFIELNTLGPRFEEDTDAY